MDMSRIPRLRSALLLTAALSLSNMEAREDSAFREAVDKTAAMASDNRTKKLAKARRLDVVNLTWEDTGRFKGSSVGPNISDMTIQVHAPAMRGNGMTARAMPVIRHPNFSDKTADIDPRQFTLLVGNEKGRPLRRISLEEFLKNPASYLNNPASWKAGKPKTLHAPKRDSRVLVSAQAAFLPVPRAGKAVFNPVLFNYQSRSGDPAVLAVLATREGTSATVIDNKRDAFSEGSAWGQRLFFNANGKRASLTGERLSDFKAGSASGGATVAAGGEAGLNMVLLIQIPLKQKQVVPDSIDGLIAMPVMPLPAPATSRAKSNVEAAVIGHGELEGPFTEIGDLQIERHPDYPVRVTVQFYKATSNGVVDPSDLAEIKSQIDRVYSDGDYVGSLVVGGDTGRVTEHGGPKVLPPAWWADFWKRHQQNTGDTPDQAREKLRQLLGEGFEERPVEESQILDLLADDKTENTSKKRGIFQRLFGR